LIISDAVSLSLAISILISKGPFALNENPLVGVSTYKYKGIKSKEKKLNLHRADAEIENNSIKFDISKIKTYLSGDYILENRFNIRELAIFINKLR
jgi:hypothetical protein